ncbi:MAG: SDR family NAD(P)-dependent oxidoreductase [Chitinophagaceae bacterium]|nr:MAG: SDR family NAD(P)-dependent oxidoreductase [Chitinophagaceae bacterium]
MKKVWFITGSSKGLGRALAEEVLKNGDQLVATARNPGQLADLAKSYGGQVLTIALDVSNKDQVREAVQSAMNQFGRIDVLVNNAGFGITGAAEAYTDEQVKGQLDVNLYAPIDITRAVLPIMRKQRSGRILQVSSVGGRVGNAGVSIYQAAKFGLSGFSEALRKEVASLGIWVTAVEPGGFRTDWGGASMSYAPEVEGYETSVGAMRSYMKSDGYQPMGDPAKAARVMYELANHSAPPSHLLLGSEALAMTRHADLLRKAEMDQWEEVSISTNHDDAADFLQTEAGKRFLGKI